MFTTVLLILFLILQAADGWTTWAIMNHGGREANPFVAYLMYKLGILPAILVVKFLAGAAAAVPAVFFPASLTTRVVLIILCVLYGIAVANNKRVLENLIRRAKYDY